MAPCELIPKDAEIYKHAPDHGISVCQPPTVFGFGSIR